MKIKNLLFIALISVLFCSFVACDFGLKNKEYVATSDEYFEFTLNTDGNAYTVRAKDVVSLPSQINLPASYDGKDVVAIGVNAFKGSNVTKVVIPDTYKEIKSGAFDGCKELKSVTLGAVETIGDLAFANCENLSTFDFPAALKTIGAHAFKNTKITNARFNAVITIGDYAFYGCEYLKSVYIPSTTTNIGEFAFDGISAKVNIDVASANEFYRVEDGKIVNK